MARPVRSARWSDAKHLIADPSWLWDAWLPRGVITAFVAAAGCGKTSVALDLARSVLTPAFWPDSENEAPLGKVLYIDSEGAGTLLKQRIAAYGVPEHNLFSFFEAEDCPIKGTAAVILNDPLHWQSVVHTVIEEHPDLIIIDSLAGSHSLDENSSAVRAVMEQIYALAQTGNCAVLCIHHLRKAREFEGGEISLDRIRGSSAINYWCRCIWAAQNINGVRRLYQIKNSFLPEDRWPRLSFELQDTKIEWSKRILMTDDEEKGFTALQAAKRFLAKLLSDNGGNMPLTEIEEAYKTAKHSRSVIYRAKAVLGITGTDTGGDRTWYLPSDLAPEENSTQDP